MEDINRFETIASSEDREEVEISDSSYIDRPCYQGLNPIPNFINYLHRIDNKPLKLNDTFKIYVLEVQSGEHVEMFDLQPSEQMPGSWKNGYSKGVALSYHDKTLIYWSIIW